MALGTDRIQVTQGNTGYLDGIKRSRLLAWNTDLGELVYTPDGITWQSVKSISGNYLELGPDGKIPLNALPDYIVLDHYLFEQLGVSGTWIVPNPFKRPVNIQVIDSSGQKLICQMVYSSDFQTVTITHTLGRTGKVILS